MFRYPDETQSLVFDILPQRIANQEKTFRVAWEDPHRHSLGSSRDLPPLAFTDVFGGGRLPDKSKECLRRRQGKTLNEQRS